MIDFDGPPASFPVVNERVRRLGFTPSSMYYTQSSTRGHWHAVIYIKEKVSLLPRIFAQLYIGSDPERERNNFIRAYWLNRRDKYAQILFEKKL